MDILDILNEMEELIGRSKRVPFTKLVLFNENILIEYLDRIQSSMPEELREARKTIQERDQIVDKAERKARSIVELAEEESGKKAEGSEIAQRANAISEDTLARAQKRADYIEQGAYDYADDLLAQVEQSLHSLLKQVHENRAELKPKPSKAPNELLENSEEDSVNQKPKGK